jgi:hypothetical protein
MRFKTGALIFSISVLGATQAWAAVLPDACGDDKVNFEVATQKSPGSQAGPEAGKAHIVFVENSPSQSGPTMRYGMDGAWVGANKGNSYFTLTVEPGVHQLCTGVQTHFDRVKKGFIEVTSLTVEAGKTYYYEAKITNFAVAGATGPGVTNGGGGGGASFSLSPLTELEGEYRIKAWKLSTSKPKS